MRTKDRVGAWRLLALAAAAPLLLAGEAPDAEKHDDLDALAAKLVTQSPGRRGRAGPDLRRPQGRRSAGRPRRAGAEAGAHPLVALTSDRLSRRLYDDVPAKYDSQPPGWDLKLAGLMDVEFLIESGDEAALSGVAPERVAAREKTFQPVFAEMRKRNVRLITLGNGLYPTASRAKQFGLSEAELSKLFWDGVNVDYARLQEAGAKLKKTIAEGKEIRLTNANGTDLKASVEKRPVLVSDGVIGDEKRKEGGAACWTYLPAGEVYVSAAPGTAEGRVVVDRLLYKGKEIDGLVLTVKGGKVVSLEAKANADELRADFRAAAEGKDRCGVIDVGVNPNVRPPAGSKVLTYVQAGMVSLSIGNDTWAGGDDNTPFGLGCFLPGSTLAVDGKVIVDKGEIK